MNGCIPWVYVGPFTWQGLHCDSLAVAHAVIVVRPIGRIQLERKGMLTIIVNIYTERPSLAKFIYGNYVQSYLHRYA